MPISEKNLSEIKLLNSKITELLKDDTDSTQITISYPFTGTFGISQHFGENPQLYTPYGYAGHFGVDFLTPWGTPILAVDDGKVIRSAFTKDNGNYVEIRHSWGSSLYLHFKEFPLVSVGQDVRRGQNIGYAGNTGRVIPAPTAEKPLSGTHLHFSIKINGVANPPYKDFVDPLPHLKTA